MFTSNLKLTCTWGTCSWKCWQPFPLGQKAVNSRVSTGTLEWCARGGKHTPRMSNYTQAGIPQVSRVWAFHLSPLTMIKQGQAAPGKPAGELVLFVSQPMCSLLQSSESWAPVSTTSQHMREPRFISHRMLCGSIPKACNFYDPSFYYPTTQKWEKSTLH